MKKFLLGSSILIIGLLCTPSILFAVDFCIVEQKGQPPSFSCVQKIPQNQSQCIDSYTQDKQKICEQVASDKSKEVEAEYKKSLQDQEKKQTQDNTKYLVDKEAKEYIESFSVCKQLNDEEKCKKYAACSWFVPEGYVKSLGICRTTGEFNCEKLPETYCTDIAGIASCSWDKENTKCIKSVTQSEPNTNVLQSFGNRLNKLGTINVQTFIGRVIKTAMGIMGSIALVMIIYGGVLWMIAGGSSDKSKKGLEIIIWSSLGIAVIFASYALVDLVFGIFT